MQNILTLFRKEVSSFLNSLIGYLVIGVFLIGTGLFFWVFEFNALESGYAGLDILFDIGPYLFLFLIPAITMRAFSEEFKSGTIEFLATKPLTEWQIILGKYFAAVFLVLFSLLPTLIYYVSIYLLGEPAGNLDSGATWGAYIGLFFLGCIFAAIGIFTSTLTDSQIVAFILGVVFCFVFYQAFDFVTGIDALGPFSAFIGKIGIIEHYRSISRGVIDTRDALYFVSFVAIVLMGARMVLEGKKR